MRSLALIALLAVPALAAPPPRAPSPTTTPAVRYALFRLDALGLSPEIVEQLEGILRVELGRAAASPLPPRQAIDDAVAKSPRYANCTADPACLAPLARDLGVQRIVAGNVGGLGDSYIVNLKLVDVSGKELARVSATLHGNPDELIQEVRVAVFKLVAPQRLTGSISLLSEVPGAEVFLDDKRVGVTPLPAPIDALPVGEHLLRVARPGWADYTDRVQVRFEKATEVLVRQRAVTVDARIEQAERTLGRSLEPPFYARWWFWVSTAALSVAVGVAAGGLLAGRQEYRSP